MYVTVSVLLGKRRIFPWKMFLCSEEHTFGSLFEDIRKDLPDEIVRVTKCSLSKSIDCTQSVEIELGFNVLQCCSLNGQFIRYIVEKEEERDAPSQQNAFTVLMSSAKELRLPSKLLPPEKYDCGRGDHRLHDDIITFLGTKKLGFGAGTENATGKQVVKALSDALFYFQPHYKSLSDRIPHFVPSYFDCFLVKTYNNPAAHRHRVAPIKREMLIKITDSLYAAMILPALQTTRWKEFTDSLHVLSENCHKYIRYLEEKAVEVQKNHHSPSPSRSVLDDTSSNRKFLVGATIRKPCIVERYKVLEQKLLQSGEYGSPVFLNDFSPVNSRLRYIYFHEIALPFKIEIYVYHHGNNLGSLWYAWKIPCDPQHYDPDKSQKLVSFIQQNISQYHSREMRRQFCQRFGLVLKAKPAVMKELYQFLTGDSSTTSIEEHVQQKLKFMLDSQDPEVIYDLREINPGRREKYEEFWAEVRALINEKSLAAVDSRRHGTTCHLAFAFSVRDLRDQVVTRNSNIDVPSLEWIRAQFWPRNPFRRSSSGNTCRLAIKFMIQSRQLHADHVDSHYCAAIFKYLKQFAIMFRDHSTMVCLDDKHNIKIGEPDFPVAAIDRGKEVLVGISSKFMVGDHDFTKAKFTPSVALICDIPDDIGESFYRGKVCVTIKDAIFQASSPKRHAAELKKLLTAASDQVNPILCLYTDGGPDHRNTYLSVQISLISLFIDLDLDMLVAARTAPQNSYRNPVERVMSLLNIGLQAVGVMRQKMPDDFEKVIRRCNSMQEIRTAAAKQPGFEEAFSDCVQPAVCLLMEVINRLKLKDEPVRTQSPCTLQEIDGLWQRIQEVDSTVLVTDTRKEHLKARTQLQAFLSHCCVQRHYFFCIKKCGIAGCKMCKPPRLPSDLFNKLNFFPDPEKKPASDSYCEFASSWGKSTSEKDRPSLASRKSTPAKSTAKVAKPFRMTAETVCDVIVCGECLKPRCMYSKRKLTKDDFNKLAVYKEDYLYSCGGTILPEADEDINSLCTHEILDGCIDSISPHYYASRLKNTPCCYHCGSYGDLRSISDVTRKKFQTIHPVCTECYAAGIKERTRGPRFAGKKRTATEASL